MPVILEGMGLEFIVDEMFITLREELNDAIVYITELYAERDLDRARRLGVELAPFAIEPVDDTPRPPEFPYGNFHVGSIPSFVQTDDRVVNYPMVVVMPVQTTPDAEDAREDQRNVYSNAIQVHSFGRANPLEGPEVAYRRSLRMAEAVHNVVHSSDSPLRQIVGGVQGPTLVRPSEPWLFPSEDGHGDDWVWQAVMHQYQVRNYSTTL